MSAEDHDSWSWIGLNVVLAIHDRQIAEHGGSDGIRDLGAIESALARPLNLAAYGDPDAALLAATYMYGLAKNHGFIDGNKRVAWIVGRLFLLDNGYRLVSDPLEAIRIMESVAAGRAGETELAEWLRVHLRD